MNKILKLLLAVLLFSCHKYSEFKKSEANNDKSQVAREFDATVTAQEEDWLIIGGQKVIDFDTPWTEGYEYYRNTDIENIESIGLYIDPQDTNRTSSLEGIEQLVNLRYIYIHGWNWDMIDYTPLKSLQHLETIKFGSGEVGKLTKVPDLSGLASKKLITAISFSGCALTILDNIEFLPNLKTVTIGQDGIYDLPNIKPLNQLQNLESLQISASGSVFRLEEIPALSKLQWLKLICKIVDVKGIERLSSLEFVDITHYDCDIINRNYFSGLKNLKELRIALKGERPDIRFLESMTGLKKLYIIAAPDDVEYGDVVDHTLDVTPIGSLTGLEQLKIHFFFLENVAAFDKLENIEEPINLDKSIFKNDRERTKKEVIFQLDGR